MNACLHHPGIHEGYLMQTLYTIQWRHWNGQSQAFDCPRVYDIIEIIYTIISVDIFYSYAIEWMKSPWNWVKIQWNERKLVKLWQQRSSSSCEMTVVWGPNLSLLSQGQNQQRLDNLIESTLCFDIFHSDLLFSSFLHKNRKIENTVIGFEKPGENNKVQQ